MSEHTILATIPHGAPDLGAEVDVRITFEYRPGRPAKMYLRNGDPGYPADPDEIEFIKAEPYYNGKPSPYDGAFADLEQRALDDLARDWIEGGENDAEIYAAIEADEDRAREFAAELRADR